MVEGADPTEGFVILADGSPIGYIQRYRMSDEPVWSQTIAAALHAPDAAGIDYFIGEKAMVGRGVGSAAIRSFVDELWSSYADITRVVVAVQQQNVASWHTLENAGFQRAWSGRLETDDPGDRGPAFLYVAARPRGVNDRGRHRRPGAQVTVSEWVAVPFIPKLSVTVSVIVSCFPATA